MRVSRVSTKEKRRYALDNLGGVDFSSSLLLCAPNRSPDAVNWIGDHGINRKRHGWEQVVDRFTLTDGGRRINSIAQISDNKVLIHAKDNFYLLSYSETDGKWSSEDVTIPKEIKTKNQKSQCFIQGEKVYIVGAADSMLVYDGSNITEADPYIPTTTIDIDNESVADPARSSFELVNLLTARRKNTLRGVNDANAVWKLDGDIYDGHVTIVTINGTEYRTRKSNGRYSKEVMNGNTKCGEIDYVANTFNASMVTTPNSNDANIVVEFTNLQSGTIKDVIGGCTFGTLYGYGGAHDRLFLSGNYNHKNMIFFSEENDFTYFPDTYTITLGGENDPAKGFLYLADTTLAVLCERSVYYIGGEGRTEYDESGNIKKITPVFTRQAGAISEGALNAFCAANFGGDNVFLSRHGLFGIEPTSNVLTNTRTARERSYAISASMRSFDANNASIFTHGQRLYISDGENCFVADSAYKYVPTGSDGYNYEWWYWTHVPARVWAEVNGELWFGTADGRVCRFTDGYKDVTWDYTSDAEIVYKDDVSITYDEKDNVGEIVNGRRVRFTSGGWEDAIGDLTEVDLYARITDKGLQLARYDDATDDELIKFTGNGQNPILRVYDDRPVVASWMSPPLDLGNDSIAKTLFSISVTAEAGQRSKLTFGYETRKGGAERLALGLGKFDFNDFDFNDFSFETGFQNSFTVRAHDRNFNFIRFYFRSDGDRPCAVHRISAIYKNNMYNKGVV